MENLFNPSFDEDYYKLIRTNSAFNRNYIERESKGVKDKILQVIEYLKMIRPFLGDIINYHKTQGEWKVHWGNTVINYKIQVEWKIQLTMSINFISSKHSDEIRSMHTKSSNIEIMMGNETDENIKEVFKSLFQKYQEGLEKSMKGSNSAFDSVDLMFYKLHKISLSRGGSCIDSPEWLKK